MYRALLVAQIQAASQYRVQSILWMLFSVIRPVIFLAAWVAVANSQGGQIGAYDVRDFAAYYICLSLVSNLTMSWNAYDLLIRSGSASPCFWSASSMIARASFFEMRRCVRTISST